MSKIHRNLPDPAKGKGDEAIPLAAFRQVRDEIERHLQVDGKVLMADAYLFKKEGEVS